MRLLALVDVHFGADHDRDAGENRGQPSVQARGEQKRVDDLRLRRGVEIECERRPRASANPDSIRAP